jgi:acyl dehydratase
MKAYIDKYLPHKYAGASGDFNAIHLDHELGLNAGLCGNILHGMCTMSIGASFALHARPEVKEFKYFKARFSGMVQPGDTLSYEGSFKEDQKIFCFDCKNQSGAKVLEQAEVRY